MKNSDFKAVIFDMDGVIFDSERLVVECWQEVAAKYGIPDVENTCKSCMGLTREATRIKFKEKYGQNFPYDEYKEENRKLFFSKELPVKPGVLELFKALKERGKLIALASSTRSDIVKMELRDAGLLDYFDTLVCGDMVKNSKPDPEIFLRACDNLRLSPSECYGIEDSRNGVTSIYNAHMRAILVPDMIEPDEEMCQMAEVVLPSLMSVREYLL